MSGSSNNFFKTTDGGNNWSFNNAITADGFALSSVYFPTSNEGYLAGTYGTIFKSTDTGNNWTAISTQGTFENMTEINFPSKNTGYIITNDYYAMESKIYKTINSGNNWFSLAPVPYSHNVNFFDNNTGYVVSLIENPVRSLLLKSIDGGLSWNRIFESQISSLLYEFVDANTGFVTSRYDYFYKTTNGGTSWTSQSFFPLLTYLFQFPLHDIGYMLFDSGVVFKLYKTINTGDNWTFINNSSFNNTFPADMYFVNENLGFLINYNPSEQICKVFKTTDGGISWNNVYSTGYFSLTIKFINNNTGYIAGVPGLILRTINQGDDWDSTQVSDRPVNDIEFTDDNTGYFVGNGGMIKKTTTGGIIAIENITSTVPDNFILEQNYPNPFNPNTVISYQLTVSSFVSLKVYDVIGKEVAVLVNEKQFTGRHSVDFNGSNLPSGIYFYKIKADNFSETKKMILLK